MSHILRLTFVVCVTLSATFARAAALSQEEVTAVVVPRMSAPPKIDGTIDPAEWREAAAISGVVEQASNTLVPRPTTFYLGWDAGHFYLAFRTYLRPGYKPMINNGRSPGLANVGDDGAELVFKPAGANVPVNNAQAAFKFFLNCLGNIGDTTKLDLGQQLKNWAPNFKTAARLTEPGTAPNGGCWCEVELSTAPADFELTGDNKVGDQWRLMLGFNHMPIWMQARIPCVGTYFEASGAGYTRVALVESAPAVQFTMDSLSNLATDGTAAMHVSAFNPAKAPATLTVAVDVAGKIVKNESLAVPAGESSQFDLNEKLPAGVTEGKASITVKSGAQTLLHYTTFFKVGEYSNYMMAPVQPRDPTKFELYTQFNPVRSWLLVKGDTYYLPDPSAAKSLAYRVVAAGENAKPIAEGVMTKTVEWYFQDLLQLPPLKPGKYQIETTMTLADGSKLGPMASEFEKKDEAKEFPEWWGGKYGNAERVLPPFTAITHKGSTITCWGREYTLDALGLPQSLNSQNVAVLAAPARVVAVIDGKEQSIQLGEPTITEATDWRIRFEGKANGAGLQFAAKGWLEQDGLVYVELTYAPDGNKTVKVDALRIEYPLAQANADGLVCLGPGANFSSKTAMLLPADKQGRLWSTLDTGRAGSLMTVGSFYPTVFVGSEQRGLMWWGDNDKGWFPENDVPAHEAIRDGDAVVLRNNIIGKPVELTESRTITFSYNGTPFRPFTKGWRMVGATEDGTFVAPHRIGRLDSKTGKPVNPMGFQTNWIHPASHYPEEWPALWAEQKAKADEVVKPLQWSDPYAARNGVNFAHMSFAFHGYGPKTIIDSLYTYFGAEWQQDTWSDTYIDYAMYLFDGALREGGVRSTYWDITFPCQYEDLLTGLAYQLPNGRIQKGYDGFNQRRFYMRLQAMMIDNHLFPNGVGVHSTNDYVPVAMPWIDAVLDGERNWNLDITPLDWVDYYPIERMRSMSSPHAWGVPICWMANMDTTSPEKRDAGKRIQAQWIWMHDSWRNPYCPPLTKMPDAVLDWGLNDERVAYHPYWRNPFVTSDDKDTLVSLWQLPDRVVLGVFNYSGKQPKDAVLKVNLEKLNLVPQLPWQEFVGVRDLWKLDEKAPNAQFDFDKRTLSVKGLQPHTLRLIGIRRY